MRHYRYFTTESGSTSAANPVSATGTYWVEAEKDGCASVSRVSVDVVIDQQPTITPPAVAGLEACAPGTVDISGSTDFGTLTYHEGSGGTGSMVGDELAVGTGGTYSLKTVNGACSATEDIAVTINEEPSATISGTATICDDGSTTNLSIELTAGTGPFDVRCKWRSRDFNRYYFGIHRSSVSRNIFIK